VRNDVETRPRNAVPRGIAAGTRVGARYASPFGIVKTPTSRSSDRVSAGGRGDRRLDPQPLASRPPRNHLTRTHQVELVAIG